jgi:hypothetical protein
VSTPVKPQFLRFVARVPRWDEIPGGHAPGLFAAAVEVHDEFDPLEQAWYDLVRDWFNENLETPLRFSRSRRTSAVRDGISWFKASAQDHVTWMRVFAALFRHHGVAVRVLRTAQPGYVLYEDEFQVVAVPFERC